MSFLRRRGVRTSLNLLVIGYVWFKIRQAPPDIGNTLSIVFGFMTLGFLLMSIAHEMAVAWLAKNDARGSIPLSILETLSGRQTMRRYARRRLQEGLPATAANLETAGLMIFFLAGIGGIFYITIGDL